MLLEARSMPNALAILRVREPYCRPYCVAGSLVDSAVREAEVFEKVRGSA
jgi:hypothetical protein